MALDTLFADGTGGLLVKVGLFLLVQALVYVILSSSSTVFSEEKTIARLGSFRRTRSVNIRRMLAAISDMPPGGEPSPSSAAVMPAIPEAQVEHERQE